MLILLHGNGQVAISQKLSELKKEFDPLATVSFNGKEHEFNQALMAINSGQLFSNKRLVVLEDFDEKMIDLSNLPEDDNLTIILKFPKALAATSSVLKTATQAKAQIINLNEEQEQSIFPFLDLLADKNDQALAKFDKLMDKYGSQYLLTMIFYMLRRLINPPQKLPSFVLKKIAVQQRNFDLEKITKLYKLSLETDLKIKSGLLDEKLGLTLLVQNILTI